MHLNELRRVGVLRLRPARCYAIDRELNRRVVRGVHILDLGDVARQVSRIKSVIRVGMIGIEQRHELIGSLLCLRERMRKREAVGIDLDRAAR